jgi:hypothetical protein
VGAGTLPFRGGWGRVEPLKEKCVYYKLFLVRNPSLWYILSRMTNLIDCFVLTLQVFAKIAYNFSPVLLLMLAFVGVMKLIETK